MNGSSGENAIMRIHLKYGFKVNLETALILHLCMEVYVQENLCMKKARYSVNQVHYFKTYFCVNCY